MGSEMCIRDSMGRGFMVDGASGIVDRLKLEYGVSRVTVRPNKKK